MITWPVLPGVGIGAQAWPNLAFGSLGSSSTKPFKLYLHWDNTQMTWKSINFFSYWGKKIWQELWAIVPHHMSTKEATIYINSLKLATDILLLLLLVYYCYYLLQSLVECSLQGQPISERTHTHTHAPIRVNLVTKLCRSPPVRTKLSPSGIPQVRNPLWARSKNSPSEGIKQLKKYDDNPTWNNLCCEFWRFGFLTKCLFCFIAEWPNSGVIASTKKNDGVVIPWSRFRGCPSSVVISRPDISPLAFDQFGLFVTFTFRPLKWQLQTPYVIEFCPGSLPIRPRYTSGHGRDSCLQDR